MTASTVVLIILALAVVVSWGVLVRDVVRTAPSRDTRTQGGGRS